MSDSAASAIRELQRAMREQQRNIFVLRSQLVDQRAVVLQNLMRIETVEGYMTNHRGERFRARYSPMAGLELSHLGRRLEMRERRRQTLARGVNNEEGTSANNEENNGEAGPSTAAEHNGNLPSTPLSSRTANGLNHTAAAAAGSSTGDGETENGISAVLEAHMNNSRLRLLRDEMVHRAVQQHIEHQHQQLLLQAQQQQQREQQAREQHVQQQLEEADQLHEQIIAEEQENNENHDPQQQQQQQRQSMQQAQYERNVRLQLRESRRFSSGAASSTIVPPLQLFIETECLICTTAPANFYNYSCGHCCLCADCAVNCVINQVRRCMLCRAAVNGIYAFIR